MHSLFANAAFAVATVMLALSLVALVALLASPVYDALAESDRFLRIPSALFLLWLVLHYAAVEGYFSALWFGLMFGWIGRAPKTKVAMTRSQLAADSIFLGALGGFGVLSYSDLVGRVLGPVGELLLEPVVLIPGSFAILLLMVWMNSRNVAGNHAAPSTPPSHA